MLDVVETLRDLVRLPSVNPMGRPVSGPIYLESRVTDYLQRLFEKLDVPWERSTVEPERDNIVARLDGRTPPEKGGRVLLLEAHQDTVPIEGMTIDPFAAEVRGDRLYGRGACDIKGGMAAMLAAFSRLAEVRDELDATIVMGCTVGEEFGYTGARLLAKQWTEGGLRLMPRAPDAIIVAEPTLLNVVIAHKGLVRWRCRTQGRAAHSSQPQLGENAIFKMAPVLQSLEKYQKDVAPTRGEHPLLGRPTLSVGVIAGGISVNTLPDQCVIEIDRRMLPEENPEEAYRHVVEFVSQHTDGALHDPPFVTAPGLSNTHNEPLADRLVEVVRRLGNSCEKIGVHYGTDAAAYGPLGIPAVVFGPGDIAQAHTEDEWIALDQLRRAADILFEFSREF
ncbi:MAG: M20 family metallopeptidase [Planctomycetes bacterium]|nr:M20 family metallopeptidase [Planctomycetota bacterium]